MYNIKISTKSSEDIQMIAQQIAQVVENATGQQCRVSVINNRVENQYQEKKMEKIMNSLRERGYE